MPASRKTAPQPAPTGRRITLNGEWYEMADLTVKDWRYIRAIPRKLTPEQIDDFLSFLLGKVRASSVADIEDVPLRDLFSLVNRWMAVREDDALPPATATS